MKTRQILIISSAVSPENARIGDILMLGDGPQELVIMKKDKFIVTLCRESYYSGVKGKERNYIDQRKRQFSNLRINPDGKIRWGCGCAPILEGDPGYEEANKKLTKADI